MNTAITTKPSTSMLSAIDKLPPDHPIRSHLAYANVFVSSGMWPDIKTASAAIVKIQAGDELGLAPFFSMRHIRIIKGNIELSSHALACLIKASGKYDYRVKEKTAKLCTIAFYERDRDGKLEPIGTETFTIEMAARAGLAGGTNWKNFPEAMLFARAISAGMRTHTPDVGQGVYHFGEAGGEDEEFSQTEKPAGFVEVEHLTSEELVDSEDGLPEVSTGSPQVPHMNAVFDKSSDDKPQGLSDEDIESMVPDTVPPVLRKSVVDLTLHLRGGEQPSATPNDAWKLVSEAATAKRERLTAPFIRSFIQS